MLKQILHYFPSEPFTNLCGPLNWIFKKEEDRKKSNQHFMHGRINVRIKWIGFTRNNELSLNRIKIQKKNGREKVRSKVPTNWNDEKETKTVFIIPHQESHTGIYWEKWQTQRIGTRRNL